MKDLVESKTNIFDRIMIKFQERKLEYASKGSGFHIWEQIKNPKVKFSRSILNLAWDKSSNIDYKNFPKYLQIEKSKQIPKFSIKSLSEDVQKDIVQQDTELLGFVTDDIKIEYLSQNPSKCEEYYKDRYSDIEKILKLEENPQILLQLSAEAQRYFVSKNPNYIYYTRKDVKENILRNSKIQDEVWENIIRRDKKLTLEKWEKYFEFSDSYQEREYEDELILVNRKETENLKKAFMEFWKSRDNIGQQNIIEELNGRENLEKENYIIAIEEGLAQGILNREQQNNVLTFLARSEDIIGKRYADIKKWDLSVIEQNFLDKYGKDKFLQYKDTILEMKKGDFAPEISNRMIRLFFKENTIIEKVEPEKLIQYVKMYDRYSKNPYDRDLKSMIQEQKMQDKFKDIMKEAFGEKSVDILNSRPGLNLFNIENTEIFREDIRTNFSRDFLDDCLSYNFTNYNTWIANMKDKEQRKAFKLYFDNASKKLGENVTTMEMCFARYSEFKDLLMDAANKESLGQEQTQKLTSLCMWPENICGIKKVEELENIDDKIGEKLKNLSRKEKKSLLMKTIKTRTNIVESSFLYSLDSLETMNQANLSQVEKKSLNFLSENNFNIGNIKTIMNISDTEDKVGFFMNTFTAIKKIQDKEIQELGNQFTTMEKIEEAIKDNKYGVKKIEVDGFSFIDLGNMPVSFAIHNPNMNNSELKHMENVGGQVSKRDLEKYLTYDEEDGMSTISARPVNESEHDFESERYIYWDFSENEVVSLSEGDGQISHKPKLPISYRNRALGIVGSRQNIKIKDYRTIKGRSGEIAFYRRKREHKQLENSKFGRKIYPNAVAKMSVYDVLKRFGKPIPIFVKRGQFSNIDEKELKSEYSKNIQEAKQKILKEEAVQQTEKDENNEIAM